MKTLTVAIKQVYGRDTIYPACDDSRTFAAMLGRKTLTAQDMDYIKRLGFTFTVATPSLEAVA